MRRNRGPTAVVYVRLPVELKQELDDRADEQGLTLRRLIEEAVRLYLEVSRAA